MNRALATIVLVALLVLAGAKAEAEDTISLPPQTLAKIQEVYQLIDKNLLTEADGKLQVLIKGLSPETLEWSFAQRLHGYVAFDQQAYAAAAERFNLALRSKQFPQSLRTTTTLDYGQALLQSGKTHEALTVLSQISDFGKLEPKARISLAGAYLEAGKSEQAVKLFEQVWSEKKQSIPSQWYTAYAKALLEMKSFDRAKRLMSEYRGRWPEEKLGWLLGAQIAREGGDSQGAFVLYKTAYHLKILQDPEHIQNLCGLAFEADVPREGARILEQALKEKRTPVTSKNLLLLSNLYVAAHDWQRAVDVLTEASPSVKTAAVQARVEELEAYITSLRTEGNITSG